MRHERQQVAGVLTIADWASPPLHQASAPAAEQLAAVSVALCASRHATHALGLRCFVAQYFVSAVVHSAEIGTFGIGTV